MENAIDAAFDSLTRGILVNRLEAPILDDLCALSNAASCRPLRVNVCVVRRRAAPC